MIILKFTKTSTAALAAHVDTLRAVTYLFRRANVEVQYSNGYNPHMELGFSAPLALGVESECEYVSVKTVSADGILERLNSVCPQGISFTKVFRAEVNLASAVNRATYRVEARGIGDVAEEVLVPNYSITYFERGNAVTKDVSSRIFSARNVDNDTAVFTLAVGNENLRPDRLVCHLQNSHNLSGDYKITKIQSFVGETPTDDFLENVEKEQAK
ncbi:MAG: TIGR03936 family radical SAM-associated protein [Corallococcus sp.]|nr:TIGR03936 family radical SAM-associated protein [Corallococcus sp.]MCM1360037.1 TIGR03936 family radical SAM-associated protein [Corallococcus sp.]MCM1395594.1 TIGR03936 family radical SAM-associated protein [Corallococcus sp.]